MTGFVSGSSAERGDVPSAAVLQDEQRVRHVLFSCWDFEIGGMSSHVLNLGRALRRRGYFVTALVMEPFGELGREFTESMDEIEVLRRGVEARNTYLARLIRRIELLAPDVLINNAVPMVQAVLPFLPEKLVRISVVHSLSALELNLAVANADWVDWIVTVSEGIHHRILRDTGGTTTMTIPVGLEMPLHTRARIQAARPLRLIYIGRIAPEKNIPGLFKVLTDLRACDEPFTMTVVGDGRALPAVRQSAAGLFSESEIKFTGSLTPAEVHRLLEQHDFLLLTSYTEGTPHAVLEAMAHGLVVVASRLPGSTDRIIRHGLDGFLCECDQPGEYVDVLRRLAAQPDEFAAVSQAARAAVQSRYSAEAAADRYVELFPRRGDRELHKRRNFTGSGTIPRALLPNFPGIIRQTKHRLADVWRGVVNRRRYALAKLNT